MPAPTELEIKAALEAVLKTKFPLVTMENGERKVDPTQLMPDMQKLADGLASALSQVWVTWQARQMVNGTGLIATPYPVSGVTLPGGLI